MFLRTLENRGIESIIGDASAYAKWILNQGGGQTSSGVPVTEQGALSLPYAYACINVLSQTLAHVPLELLRETAKGKEQATKHRLYDVMKFRPNSRTTSYDWRETLEAHRNGWGNAYARIIRDGPYPVEFPILFPSETEPHVLKRDGSVVYTSNTGDQGSQNIPAADVLHFSGLGYDGIRGYSPIHLAREAVGLGLAIHKFGAKFFGNGASPKGVIESQLAPNTLAPFLEEFKRNYGSIDQAMGTPVLPKGLTYKPIMINPNDAQALETLKFNRSEVCGLYRVPPQFIMDLERSTFTNAVEMDLHFVKHSLIPIFTNWESELNFKLLTESERRSGYHFKFSVKGLLRGSTKERYDAYHLALQDGWRNRAEIRAEEDLSHADGLDEYLVPSNMVGNNINNGQPVEQPIVESVAERMASNERRNLERIGDDVGKATKFYKDYGTFISRNLMPLAKMIEPELNCTAAEFVAKFTDRHIDAQLRQMVNRVSELVVDESAIVKLFYEIKRHAKN